MTSERPAAKAAAGLSSCRERWYQDASRVYRSLFALVTGTSSPPGMSSTSFLGPISPPDETENVRDRSSTEFDSLTNCKFLNSDSSNSANCSIANGRPRTRLRKDSPKWVSRSTISYTALPTARPAARNNRSASGWARYASGAGVSRPLPSCLNRPRSGFITATVHRCINSLNKPPPSIPDSTSPTVLTNSIRSTSLMLSDWSTTPSPSSSKYPRRTRLTRSAQADRNDHDCSACRRWSSASADAKILTLCSNGIAWGRFSISDSNTVR